MFEEWRALGRDLAVYLGEHPVLATLYIAGLWLLILRPLINYFQVVDAAQRRENELAEERVTLRNSSYDLQSFVERSFQMHTRTNFPTPRFEDFELFVDYLVSVRDFSLMEKICQSTAKSFDGDEYKLVSGQDAWLLTNKRLYTLEKSKARKYELGAIDRYDSIEVRWGNFRVRISQKDGSVDEFILPTAPGNGQIERAISQAMH